MPDHTVGDEECLDTIAFQYGFFPETIWNRGENASLRSARKTGFQLAPGDVLFVPEKRLKDAQCAIDKRHRFKRKGVPAKLRIRLLDFEGKPRKNVSYVLEIDPDTEFEGTTGSDAIITHFIPPDAVSGRLILQISPAAGEEDDGEEEEVYELALSQLRPSSMIAGIQQRLYNLGFLQPPLSGEMDERTVTALRQFQIARKIKDTGEVDGPTLAQFERDFQTE